MVSLNRQKKKKAVVMGLCLRFSTVLSDSSKRFLYDVGIYDNEDDNDEKVCICSLFYLP